MPEALKPPKWSRKETGGYTWEQRVAGQKEPVHEKDVMVKCPDCGHEHFEATQCSFPGCECKGPY